LIFFISVADINILLQMTTQQKHIF